MLYMLCSCGEILGNKQLVYEEQMRQLCDDLRMNYDMVSSGLAENNEEYRKGRSEIVNNLCRRYCCKQALITYVDIIKLIT